MNQIFKAKPADAQTIHTLVHQIYYPTYKDILSKDQIEFMLDKSYTIEAIQASMASNQDFYLLQNDQEFLGFMALSVSSSPLLRIEKLYLLPETQGKGCGKLMINFAQEVALSVGLNTLELNVNRGNKAYHFYLKQGFKVTQEVDIPYYGYILDDYVMQKTF